MREKMIHTVTIPYNMYDGDERNFTFKAWENYGKSRIYMKDYKGRTLGYIDRANDHFELSDNNGLKTEKIDQVVNDFMAKYC